MNSSEPVSLPRPGAMARYRQSWASAGVSAAVALGLMVLLPRILDDFTLIQASVYVVMSILALSLGFIWGFGGILCFGQSAMFGIGAYTYAIAVGNLGDSTVPLMLAIAVPALFSALLGYVMFYGRISDVYAGVTTLTVTLILFNLVNSTSGPEWKIGNTLLGGFNGIPGIAPLNWPGQPDSVLEPRGLFEFAMGALLLIYLGLRALLRSKTGRVIVAVRENEQRASLLGYDTRAYKLLVFTIGGAIAGLAGCLFATWGSFTSPNVFGLAQSAQIIIWVMVGGAGTLVGPVLGCVAIQWLTAQIGTQQTVNASLVLGAIVMATVLLLPSGIVPSCGALIERIIRLLAKRPTAHDAAPGSTSSAPERSA